MTDWIRIVVTCHGTVGTKRPWVTNQSLSLVHVRFSDTTWWDEVTSLKNLLHADLNLVTKHLFNHDYIWRGGIGVLYGMVRNLTFITHTNRLFKPRRSIFCSSLAVVWMWSQPHQKRIAELLFEITKNYQLHE